MRSEGMVRPKAVLREFWYEIISVEIEALFMDPIVVVLP